MGRASFPPSFLPSNLLTCGPPLRCHGNKGGGSQITGSGFLPGAGPRGCPLQTHAPFTLPLRVGQQGCFSLLPPPPTPIPPISWLRLSKSQPGLCLKSSHPGQDSRDRVSARRGSGSLRCTFTSKPRNPVGGRSQRPLSSHHPKSQGGGTPQRCSEACTSRAMATYRGGTP